MLGSQVTKWLQQATGTRESVGSEQSESEVQSLSSATTEIPLMQSSHHEQEMMRRETRTTGKSPVKSVADATSTNIST